jgi:hypothetical protein
MKDQTIYDYKVVDEIRAKEAELEAAIESKRRSINLLKASVIRLRNTRLAYEMCETSDA